MTDIAVPVSEEQLYDACDRARNVSGDEHEVAQLLGLTPDAYSGLVMGYFTAACSAHDCAPTSDIAKVGRDMFFTGILLGRFLYGEVVTDG